MATNNTSADQKQVVDPTNFNAWRKTINPNADDYTFQGNEKDTSVIDWANKNGYDNSKNYTIQGPTLRQAQQPQAQGPQAPTYNYGLADQAENEYLKRNKQDDTYLSRFSSIYPAPKEYTPQQEETQRNAASVAESLKSLAEIYGQAKGAHLQPRIPEESDKAEQLIRYNRNKHDEDLRAYQRAYISAAGQDSEYLQQLRAKALGYGQNIAKNDYLSQKAAYDRAMKENDIATANSLKEKMQKSSQEFTSGENALNRANTIKAAQIRKADTDKFNGLVINAHPSDNTAQVDATGNRVIQYIMSKPEIENLAMTAKNDKTFLDRHPELMIDKPDMFGTPHKGLTTDQEIANTYAQERYNSKFVPAASSNTKTTKNQSQTFENSPFNLSRAGKETGSKIGNIR
jgi:hypothetical protein